MKIKFSKSHKYITLEHHWRGLIIQHRWSWGFGQPLRYYRSWLPF